MLNTIKTKHLVTAASFSCIVHCLVTPVIILLAPFLGHIFHNPVMELSMLALSILCGSWIIHTGYCKHKKTHTFYLFGAGTALWVLHTVTEHMGIEGGKLFLIVGTAFVIGSYFVNHRFLKCCESC